MTTTLHFTLITTSAQVCETSVTTTENSLSQDYPHPDDRISRSNESLFISLFMTESCFKVISRDPLLIFAQGLPSEI